MSPRWRPPRTMARLTQILPPADATAITSVSSPPTFSMVCWCSTLDSEPIWSRSTAASSKRSSVEACSMRASISSMTSRASPLRKRTARCTSWA
ncbi:Uncharacterised protein [Bordetella pertussis]|nr:Uncharacterised protein [Bordetella pertussis]